MILASKEAVRHFDSAGGSIINISSSASTLTLPNTAVYSATKAAVDAVTRSLAKTQSWSASPRAAVKSPATSAATARNVWPRRRWSPQSRR
ncbi:MAG TPA: SDR family NAD(P)-dependent oxidoreductase [Methylomirabilota bacterium]|nr:SDR family NAD(P)-dependent oxidoreductase [Methylomirabilota bacterium]